jgi:hypothetical protein
LPADDVCTFHPKTPSFNKVAEELVTATAKSTQDASLLNRLRSVEDENTEWMVIAGKYAYVLSNITWMSVYGTQ